MTLDERAHHIAACVCKTDRSGGLRQRVYEVALVMLREARDDGKALAMARFEMVGR